MSEVLARPRMVTRDNIRTLRFMNGQGHTSFGWDPEDDQWVLPMIREKMRQGFVFWIVRRARPERRLEEVRLDRIEDIGDTRNVIIRDDASRQLFEQGHIGLVSDTNDEIEVEGPARTPEAVVANDTIAHRAFGRG
jgi:hypothetical protein